MSQIALIVDYTAALAAGIEGVTAVFGVGTDAIGDPLRPGSNIRPAPDAPTAAFTHWSDMPDAPVVERASQTGAVEYTWDVPLRLWLPRGDLANLRRLAAPFYARYSQALALDPRLGGYALTTPSWKFERGSDDYWAWLDLNLTVTELVRY